MNIDYSVHNFRIFDSNGAKLSLHPITILTGCNSSGKSSLVKSIILLKNYVLQAQKDIRLNGRFCPQDYALDFTVPGMKLGSVETSRHYDTSIDDPIIFSYIMSVKGSLMKFYVELKFKQRSEDDVNAWLDSLLISSYYSKEVILKVSVKDEGCLVEKLNMNTEVLAHFWRFYTFSSFRKNNELYRYYSNKEDKKSARTYEKDSSNMLSDLYALTPRISSKEADAFDYAYEDKSRHGLSTSLNYEKEMYDVMKKVFDLGVLFYLPILEDFKGKSKAESVELLKHAISFNGKVDQKLIEDIIGDFNKSEYTSFIEYYKALENEELENMERRFRGTYLIGGEDLFSYLKDYSSITNVYSTQAAYCERISFEQVYSILCNWQLACIDLKYDKYLRLHGYIAHSKVYSQYFDFFVYQLRQILLPNFAEGLGYIGNSHTTVHRVYSFEDKDNNLVDTIQEYIILKRKYNSFIKSDSYKDICMFNPLWESYRPANFTNKWIKEFNLGESIKVVVDKDGLGAKLLIRKRKDDKLYHSLADEGYGVTQMVILLLRIEIEILNTILGNRQCLLRNRQLTEEMSLGRTLAIEEPEVSLHPSLQSKLALIIKDAYLSYGVSFIIETHSEYLIRKLQTLIASQEISDKMVSIYYFTNDKTEPVKNIGVTSSGSFKNQFGTGFFDEADNLTLALMKSNLLF